MLETGCLVADSDTGVIQRGEWQLPLGGTAPIQWSIHQDIPTEIVNEYSLSHELMATRCVSESDAIPRVQYYLNGMAVAHKTIPGETRQYIGLYPIELNGVIQQVTWSLGGSGPTTTASANGEHSTMIPAYPARRRRENLDADAEAARANIADLKVSNPNNQQAVVAAAS